jgi:hypothetical protein
LHAVLAWQHEVRFFFFFVFRALRNSIV